MTTEMAMVSIFESRIFYNWRMARRGGVYLVASLVSAALAGGLAAAAHHSSRVANLGVSPAMGLVGFVVLAFAAGLFWWRFSSFQDEMFHRIQHYSYGWGAAVSMILLIIWGIANAAQLAPPINPWAPLFLFAIIKAMFWTKAVRTWL